MLRCGSRNKAYFNKYQYCNRDGQECGLGRWAWCKGVVFIMLALFAFAYFAYGVVYAWQEAEDRRQGSVVGGQGSMISERLERLNAGIRGEADRKELVLAILACESSNRQNVWGDGGKSYGIAQVQKRTWDYLAPKAGIKGDWKDPGDQVALLEWAIENGYGDHWTCYRKLKEA